MTVASAWLLLLRRLRLVIGSHRVMRLERLGQHAEVLVRLLILIGCGRNRLRLLGPRPVAPACGLLLRSLGPVRSSRCACCSRWQVGLLLQRRREKRVWRSWYRWSYKSCAGNLRRQSRTGNIWHRCHSMSQHWRWRLLPVASPGGDSRAWRSCSCGCRTLLCSHLAADD